MILKNIAFFSFFLCFSVLAMEEQKESVTQFKDEYFKIAFHIIKPNEYEENQVFNSLEEASRNVLDNLSELVTLTIKEWKQKAKYVINGIPQEALITFNNSDQVVKVLLEKDNWIHIDDLIDSTNLFHDSKDFLQKFLLIKCLRNPNFIYSKILKNNDHYSKITPTFFNQILKNNIDLFVISLLENCVYDCYSDQITNFIRIEDKIQDDKEVLNELLQTPKQFKSRADSLLEYINNLSVFMEKSTQLFDQNKLKETRNIINSYQKALEILISKKEENERYSVDDGDIEIIPIKNDNSSTENHDNYKKNRKQLEIIKRWLFPGIGIVGIFALLGYAIKKSMRMKK